MFLCGPPLNLDFYEKADFWTSVNKVENGCWLWTQSTGSHGYGQTWDGVTVRLAHRVAWSIHHGMQVPPWLTVDHLCRNRTCVNPAHLRLLTNTDNARDNGQSRKTHCPVGHPYDDVNTRRNSKGHRLCRACARENARRRNAA